MNDKNYTIEIQRVGNGFIVQPFRDRYSDCVRPVGFSETQVFQTMRALLAHIEQHFPPKPKARAQKP